MKQQMKNINSKDDDKETIGKKTLTEYEYLGIIYYILGDVVYDSEYIIRKEKGKCVGTYKNGGIIIHNIKN